MKNILSFKTAKALKDAGFPQPTAETGQFWYNDYGALTLIGRRETAEDGGEDLFYCTSISTGRTDFFVPALKDAVFAPTATDILEQLGEYFSIEAWNGQWAVNQRPAILPEPIGYPARYHGVDTNAAEAAAAAWLAMKK